MRASNGDIGGGIWRGSLRSLLWRRRRRHLKTKRALPSIRSEKVPSVDKDLIVNQAASNISSIAPLPSRTSRSRRTIASLTTAAAFHLVLISGVATIVSAPPQKGS